MVMGGFEVWLQERAKRWRWWSRQIMAAEESRELCESLAFELELALSKLREEQKGVTNVSPAYYETHGPVGGRLAEHDKDLGKLFARVAELEDRVSDLTVRLGEVERGRTAAVEMVEDEH